MQKLAKLCVKVSETIEQLRRKSLRSFILHKFVKIILLCQHFSIITDLRALVWIYSFKEPDGVVARQIEKLGYFNFDINYRAGRKIPHAECVSRINTEDYEKNSFFNANLMDAEQSINNYGSRGWKLDNLQGIKLRDSQQNDKLPKEVYSWVLNRKDRNHGK